MFLKKFEKIYQDVDKYHNKNKEKLLAKCSEDIAELLQSKPTDGAWKVMTRLKEVHKKILLKYVFPSINKKEIESKNMRKEILITYIKLCHQIIYRKHFKSILDSHNQEMSFIEQYYQQLLDMDF